MNIFETGTMLPAVKREVGASTYLRDRFFGTVKEFETKKVIIDIVNGKRRVAPFVHPKIGGKVVENDGFSTNEYEAPEVSPMKVTTAEDMLMRLPGEAIMGAKSPDQRAAEKLGEDLADLDKLITRRESLMCSEALFEGQVTVKGDGYDEVIRFWPTDPAEKPYLELTGDARWGGTASNSFQDLRDARRDIIKKSGIAPTEVIMGSKAIDAFLKDLKERKLELDYSAVKMGTIDPQHLADGVTYWGRLTDSALDIYTYDEYVIGDDGKDKPLVPEDKVLIGSPRVPTVMAYGVVSLMRGSSENAAPEFYAERRVPDSWTQRQNPAGRIVQIKSKPLPIINQIAGFKVLKVI